MFALLDNTTPWIWIGLGFLLGILELVLPSTIFLWPALAALLVGLTAFLVPELLSSGLSQVLYFVFLSVLSVIAGRTFMIFYRKKNKGQDETVLNDPLQRNIGKTGTVYSFEDQEGIVLIDGIRWNFRLKDGSQNPITLKKIKILEVKGSTLIGEPINEK